MEVIVSPWDVMEIPVSNRASKVSHPIVFIDLGLGKIFTLAEPNSARLKD